MDINEIKQLIELMTESDLSELQLEREGVKIRLRRQGGERPAQGPQSPQESVRAEPVATVDETLDELRMIMIKSPIVGTFYRGSSPDAPYFVNTGDRIKKGQVLCIIEAMKLMNEIESEVDGTVTKILVENSTPVEYGEPLFMIDPL